MALALSACKKKKIENEEEDLFNALQQSGYTYYQNGAVLSAAAPSPHGSFKLRLNAVAQAVVDSAGEIPAGNSFPEGSIIVKEVYSGNSLNLYAIMKKTTESKYAASGWVWAEFDPQGKAIFSISKKGDGCISCHSGTPNRDLVRTYDLH